MTAFLLAALIFYLNAPLAIADPAPARQEAALIREYHGAHTGDFTAQYDRVRQLMREAQVEVSSRLGLLQYREGFQYPLLIRFEDGTPAGVENALAYVRLFSSGAGFQQELVVNLDAMAKHSAELGTVFYHEMTHTVMNDAVGGEASQKIPHWVQEGLAVYISGEGDERVKKAAKRIRKSQAKALVFPLGGPVYGAAYPQYYLAVKYMIDTGSVNAVQGTVRELIAGKPLDAAIQDTLGQTWEQFQDNVKAYSLKIFKDLALSDYVTTFQ